MKADVVCDGRRATDVVGGLLQRDVRFYSKNSSGLETACVSESRERTQTSSATELK